MSATLARPARRVAALVAGALLLVVLLPHPAAAVTWSASDGSVSNYRFRETTGVYSSVLAVGGSFGVNGRQLTVLPGTSAVPGSCQVGLADCTVAGTLRDDEISGCLSVPFKFTYYGTLEPCVYVGANGFVTFTPTTAASVQKTPAPLPLASAVDLIAGYWTDLVPSACGADLGYVSSPTRLVVEWANVPVKPTSGLIPCGPTQATVSFQIVLTPDGLITFSSGGVSTTALDGSARNAALGIQGGSTGLNAGFGKTQDRASGDQLIYSANRAPIVSLYSTWGPTIINEDHSIELYWIVNEPDGDAVTLTATAGNGTMTLESSYPYDYDGGTYTYELYRFTPPQDFNDKFLTGPKPTTQLLVTATDVLGASGSAATPMHVSAVNDAPTITLGANVTAAIHGPTLTLANWASGIAPGPATAIDEAGQTLDLTLAADHPELFRDAPTLSTDGTLSFRPASTAGVAIVTVTLHDNGGTKNGGQDTTVASFNITLEDRGAAGV